ncbi:MAG: hypothetical protein ABII01_02900 [Candidatus Woesearchaeota archaeon]
MSIVYAAGFSVTSNPISDSITLDDTAVFELTVRNNEEFDDRYRIFYSDVLWDFHTDPRTDSTFEVDFKSTETTRLVFAPNELEYGTHVIPLNVKSLKTEEVKRLNLAVSIVSDEQDGGEIYGTAVRTNIVMKDEADPRDELVVTIELENRNPKNNPDLTLVIESDIFKQQQKVSLAPYEKKKVDFKIDLDDLEKPGKHFLDSYLLVDVPNNRTLIMGRAPKSMIYEIIEYGELLEDRTLKKGFLKSTETITLTNNGNVGQVKLFKVETNLFKKLFQKVTPGYSQIFEDGSRYYGFDISLDPAEKIEIVVKSNYSIIFWLLLLIIIIIVLYFIFRSPIRIIKTSSNVIMKEGGISEVRIMVHVKNISYKPVDDVVIFDQVPHIAEVIKEFPVGTLKPTSILNHDKKGTLLKWHIDSLDSFEERILTYNIKSRLSILGGFILPQTKGSFKNFGRKRSVLSNKFNFKL